MDIASKVIKAIAEQLNKDAGMDFKKVNFPVVNGPFCIAQEFGIWSYTEKNMIFPECIQTSGYIYGDLYAETLELPAVISPPQDCLLEVNIKFWTYSDPVIEPYAHESPWGETGSE